MPLVNIKVIRGVFTAEQRQDMVRRLTDAMVEIESKNRRPVTWSIVEEVTSEDWGIGGQPMHTADVKALAAIVRCGPFDAREKTLSPGIMRVATHALKPRAGGSYRWGRVSALSERGR